MKEKLKRQLKEHPNRTLLAGPIHLFGWYSLLTAYDAYAIPGLLIVIFTTLPVLGTALGWAAWAYLRRRSIL